jgi:hypothetical protein
MKELEDLFQAVLRGGKITDEDVLNVQNLENNKPRAQFDGLSAVEVRDFVVAKIEESTLLTWQPNISDDTLDNIPMFRLLEGFFTIIEREKDLKLTPLGAIQKKILVELYELGWISESIIEKGITKLTREQDSVSITTLVAVSGLAGFTRKEKGKLFLTAKTSKLLAKNDRLAIFKHFFVTYFSKYNLGYTDGYNSSNFGQDAWRFNIYLLLKYGEKECPTKFYAHKYMDAFPMNMNLNRFGGEIKSAEGCYELRIFRRFLMWFDFVALEEEKYLTDGIVAATPLLSKIFLWNKDQSGAA